MTRFVGTPLRGIEFSSPSDEAVSARVNGDSQPRIRIDAGGRITWSSGSASGDTNLYRDAADTLVTDDIFKATGGLVTLTTDGAPTEALPDGAVAIDTTNNVFYFRSDGTWNQVTAGGGASITISDTEPVGAEVGDLWFESDTGSTYVYYDSFWVEVGGIGLTTGGGGSSTLDGLTDVNTPAPASGSFLMWDGSQWKDQAIELGNNTTGNYVSGITAGTGISVTHTPGEGSSPTIAIDAELNDLTDVDTSSALFTGAQGTLLYFNGTNWVATRNTYDQAVYASGNSITATEPLPGGLRSSSLTTDGIIVSSNSVYGNYQTVVGNSGIEFYDTGNVVADYDATRVFYQSGSNYLSVGRPATLSGTNEILFPDATGTVALGQSVATTDSPTFAGMTADNVRIGITSSNTIDTSSGNLILDSAGTIYIGSDTPTTNTGIVMTTKGSADTSGGISLTPGFAVGAATGATGGDLSLYSGGAFAAGGTAQSGTISITAGMAYGAATNIGGNVVINAGSASGGTNGSILIGTITSSPITIGKSGQTTTVGGALVVSGDLTVNGTTTTVNTQTLLVEDNLITLNSNAPGPTTASAGIEVYRGPAFPTPTVRWSEPDSSWQFSNDGTTYTDFAEPAAYDSAQAVLAGRIFS